MTDQERFDDVRNVFPADATFLFETPLKDNYVKLPVSKFNEYVSRCENDARIYELNRLHRREGDDLPDRDYDNVTDTLIDERLEQLDEGVKTWKIS